MKPGCSSGLWASATSPTPRFCRRCANPLCAHSRRALDVFASLGSERAEALLETFYQPAEKWADYMKYFNLMKEKFTNLPDTTWQSNMYYAWLWTQTSLTGEYGEGYPMFMRNTAWQDKSLATALASWAEMRHDTILYAKQSGAECGGDNVPPVVRAYVEPNAELYNRLLWLTQYSRENLSGRGILPENIKTACESFENMLAFLRDCSVKELNGEDLTSEELRQPAHLRRPARIPYLEQHRRRIQVVPNRIGDRPATWRVIADVHTVYPSTYLEEGVGTAAEIYVVVPMGGELYLTRGAVFDYFEFTSDKRLTDEEWQAMIKDSPPERPPFTASFIEGEAEEGPAPGRALLYGMLTGRIRLAAAKIAAAAVFICTVFALSTGVLHLFRQEVVISVAGDVLLDRGRRRGDCAKRRGLPLRGRRAALQRGRYHDRQPRMPVN